MVNLQLQVEFFDDVPFLTLFLVLPKRTDLLFFFFCAASTFSLPRQRLLDFPNTSSPTL
jgi:hypothetical protein